MLPLSLVVISSFKSIVLLMEEFFSEKILMLYLVEHTCVNRDTGQSGQVWDY